MKYFFLQVMPLFVLLLFICCKTDKDTASPPAVFKNNEITIPINGVLNIRNCANWYIDFSRIKRTVIFKDKIICVGLNGGFACLNSASFKLDTTFQRKLNTDFFTNVSVFNDTLFAEKFDQLFFWKSDKWTAYTHPLPIRYFNLLLENKKYAFFNTCMGEFGGMLYVYDKATKTTRAALNDCQNSVVETSSGYFVGTEWLHSYTIKDITQLKTVPDTLKNEEARFVIDPRFDFIRDNDLDRKRNQIPLTFSYRKQLSIGGKIIPVSLLTMEASFNNKGRMYHIIGLMHLGRNKKLVATVINDTLEITGKLENCKSETALQFGNSTIINEQHSGNGFTMIRNDTIFKISFSTQHPTYQGPKLEGYNLITDQSKKTSSNATYKVTSNDIYTEPFQTSIEFKFGNKYRIIGNRINKESNNFICIYGQKIKLKFHDNFNFIEHIFVYDNRLFVFFRNNANREFKYGLIEITDMDSFASMYKE